MTPRIGRLTPVKAALGRWLVQFHAQFDADTPENFEWAQREPSAAMTHAPARMVDQVESMLSSWRRNDNSGEASTSAYLPVLFAAVAPDYTETPGEHGRPLTDYMPIAFDDDTLKRSFLVRAQHVDLRAQIVVVSASVQSTFSIIGQLCHWAIESRRTFAPFEFAGFTTQWPVHVLAGDRMAITMPQGEHISALALDLTLRATLPRFKGPADGEPNDGHDPPGFPLVQSVTNQHDMAMGPPTGVSEEEWAYFASRVRWSDGASRIGLHPIGDASPLAPWGGL
jgi:hypothetical protein